MAGKLGILITCLLCNYIQRKKGDFMEVVLHSSIDVVSPGGTARSRRQSS
jgi:hypothetical protein